MLSWGVDNTSATPCTQLLEPSNYFSQCSQNEHDTNEKGPVGNKAAAQKCSYSYGGTLFIKLSKLIERSSRGTYSLAIYCCTLYVRLALFSNL